MDERNGSLGCFYLLAFSRGGRRERGGLLLASLLLREGVVGSETDSSSQSIYCLVIEVPPVDFFFIFFHLFPFFFSLQLNLPNEQLNRRLIYAVTHPMFFFLKILTHPMVLASAQTYP